MRVLRCRADVAGATRSIGAAVFFMATAVLPKADGQQITLNVDPAQSQVHYTVDSSLHTVHGTFKLKDGTVQIDSGSGKANGEVTVYATSGDSGNSARDERMHKEILETAKYPNAIFHPTQIEGTLTPGGASDLKLHGVLLLHGGEHPIVATVHAAISGDHWTGTARFAVPYIAWGIKNPSNWLLKVKPVVEVELDMAGTASTAK